MKRKATLDAHIQADAKAAFRRLRLQINQLERDRRHHRQDIDRYIPTPVGLDVLITQAKQLRRELEYWSTLVSGHLWGATIDSGRPFCVNKSRLLLR
jgi:hypothetical protein